MMADRFKVGDEIYVIGPMWDRYGRRGKDEKYIPRIITSITSRSYVCGETKYDTLKIPKSSAMNKDEAARQVWADKWSYKIHESARGLKSYDDLQALAKLTGWKEPEKKP